MVQALHTTWSARMQLADTHLLLLDAWKGTCAGLAISMSTDGLHGRLLGSALSAQSREVFWRVPGHALSVRVPPERRSLLTRRDSLTPQALQRLFGPCCG